MRFATLLGTAAGALLAAGTEAQPAIGRTKSSPRIGTERMAGSLLMEEGRAEGGTLPARLRVHRRRATLEVVEHRPAGKRYPAHHAQDQAPRPPPRPQGA